MRLSEEICEVVEAIEQSRAGGYYPGRLSGHLNQRYKIIGKLTYSQYYTIWLVKDHTANIPRYGLAKHQQQTACSITSSASHNWPKSSYHNLLLTLDFNDMWC